MNPKVQCRVRVTRGEDIAVGPGKMELLAAIRDVGSISGAARRMQMSYRRAWLLVETMNSCFQHPLVVTATGGRAGGGAHLTPEGEKVLEGYTAMMREIDEIAERYLASLLGSSPLTPVPPESSSGSE
ncbi:MAG: LysR family transcriptional regulator [Gammaproteobacteria bacterium]